MPKNLNYPLASFQKAFALADAVNALGGNCNVEDSAAKMQRKISGGFMVIISSAQKFELITFDKGIITISENYKLIKHSYTNTERINFLRKAFLAPQVFFILFERFKGKDLPIEMLDKILIREFGVEEVTAGRVAGYFIDGLKTCGLLNGTQLTDVITQDKAIEENEIIQTAIPEQETTNTQRKEEAALKKPNTIFSTIKSAEIANQYELHLTGPGISTTFNLEVEEDVLILEAIIKKIRKSILK
ncbi:hypothetical protein EON73_02605 [bacterium]|nr:MAG: hypothetical protein EON73_02605 [bacterium]